MPGEAIPADVASAANPAQSSNVEAVQSWLLELAGQIRGQLAPAEADLFDDLTSLSREDLGDEELATRLRRDLERFQRTSEASSPLSAADLHTRAVLEHKIATVESDRELALHAVQSYAAAQTAYEGEGPGSMPLRAACLVDAGLLHSLVLKDYPEAKQRFREARELPGVPLLLQVEAWIDEAIASAVANPDAADKYSQAGHALNSARELIENSDLRDANHPLLAHVHERYAWILMDQWNVRKASEEFKEARSIRFDNFWKSKNDFAQIFVFHNDHGQAMAERYSGDERLARAQYDLVIGEIEKALAKTGTSQDGPGRQRFQRELRERYSNSCERRADCELYQGAASGAPVDLKEAARLYALARDHADDPAVRVAMSCKRALVLALDGQTAEARQQLRQDDVASQTVIGLHEERVRLLRTLVEAVLAFTEQDEEAGRAALRSFLKAFDLDPNYPDRHRRETQELQLFAAERLLATELDDAPSPVVAADAELLDRLVAAFPYRDQMLVYLRRYYDLLIDARDEEDPDRAAGYILASRNLRPLANETMVLFHFSAHRGRVIHRSAEAGSLGFPLDFGRDEIKAAAGESAGESRLLLPPELMERLTADQQGGRKIVVFWDDRNCWARSEAALTEKDWPFGGQLTLEGQCR